MWLKNYRDLLVASDGVFGFWRALRTNVIWTVSVVALTFLVAMGGALLLNQPVRGRLVFRTLLLVPWAFPTIGHAMVWRWILNDKGGFITWVALSLGLISAPIAWLGMPDTALPAVVLISAGRSTNGGSANRALGAAGAAPGIAG